ANDHSIRQAVIRWNLDGTQASAWQSHDLYHVAALSTSPNLLTAVVATAGYDGRAHLLNANGQTVKRFEQDPRSDFGLTSIAISPSGDQLLLGSASASARLIDLEGKELAYLSQHLADVLDVAFSPDGEYLLTASEDGGIVIWDNGGQELARLIFLGDHDWAVINPDGQFDASPGAMEDLYFVQNREIIALEQLKTRYYEPGLLNNILTGNLDQIRQVEDFGSDELYPKLESATITDDNRLKIKLTPRSGGIGKVSLFLNQTKELQEDLNPDRTTEIAVDLAAFAEYYLPGLDANQLSLRLFNEGGWMKSPPLETNPPHFNPSFSRGLADSKAFTETPEIGPQSLYAIVVGSSDYKGGKEVSKLTYPDQDAASFAKALEIVGKQFFGEQRVSIQLFTTQQPDSPQFSSKAHVQAAFENLKNSKRLQPQDVLVTYFAGHGENAGSGKEEQFYYLTNAITKKKDLASKSKRESGAISTNELIGWLNGMPAQKQVLILDTCHSGKLIDGLVASRSVDGTKERVLELMKDRTGLHILAGSAADKVSFETTVYGHGLLTYSLLSGMKGKALDDKSHVNIVNLFRHSREEVPRLANNVKQVQEPIVSAPPGKADTFWIGKADEQARQAIPVASVKPVLIRSVFLDEEELRDHENLSEGLDLMFEKESNKGLRSKGLFVNVSSFPAAFAVRGLYKKAGDGKYSLKAKLFKGNTFFKDLSIAPNKADALIQHLAKEVWKVLPNKA
ncbi:MAG: caspase family protein, partial [Bacteroidota bacterium]